MKNPANIIIIFILFVAALIATSLVGIILLALNAMFDYEAFHLISFVIFGLSFVFIALYTLAFYKDIVRYEQDDAC